MSRTWAPFRKRQFKKLTKSQTYLWNEMYVYGAKELMSQKQRRTAFTLQERIGKENIEIFSPEWNDALEFIQFKQVFAIKIGAALQNRISYEYRLNKTQKQ